MDGINETEDKGVIIQGLPIYNLKFADDVDLIDKDPDNLRVMSNKLCEDSERYGMCINKDKTKSYDISEISAVMSWHFQYMEPRWNMYRTLYTSGPVRAPGL